MPKCVCVLFLKCSFSPAFSRFLPQVLFLFGPTARLLMNLGKTK